METVRRIGLAWTFGMLALGVWIAGCSGSHPPGEGDDAGTDAEIRFDAGVDARPEGGTDGGGPGEAGTDAGPPRPRCGNGVLEAGEQCDDGNEVDGDGCSADCVWEQRCGDGNVDDDEVCDDGNNASGDGCRSDCQSDERCGNGVLDVARGEVCDDGNEMDGDGCSADCRSVERCGNGMLDDGEVCDEGDTARWDGCGPDCRPEPTLVVSSLSIGSPSQGCDFTGDGEPDNAFGQALGPVRGFLNSQIEGGVGTRLIVLLPFLGLDDLSGADDDDLSVGWLRGEDFDDNPSNNLSGTGAFYVDGASLGDDGLPQAAFVGSVAARALDAGPEDIVLDTGMGLAFQIKKGRLLGRTTASGGQLDGLADGMLCGAMSVDQFALLPNLIDLFMRGMGGGGTPLQACDGSSGPTSTADLLVGGSPAGFFVSLTPTQPDVDVDGDGLERFEVVASGPPGCQPVIVACIDGDGTRVEGRDCAADPRFADGFSVGMPLQAVKAELRGVAGGGGATPPPGP